LAKTQLSRRFFKVTGQILTTSVDPLVGNAMRKTNDFPDNGQPGKVTSIGKDAHEPKKTRFVAKSSSAAQETATKTCDLKSK
jgi:hypothetical protein